VLIPTLAWYLAGSRDAFRRAQEIEQNALSAAREQTSTNAERLLSRLDSLRSRESGRPFYHYQNLYHDPRGVAQGLSVIRSPLAQGPADPLVWAHFQIDESGLVSLPTVNERFPELSTDDEFNRFCEALGELQNGLVVARLDGSESDPELQSIGVVDGSQRVTVLDRTTWEQIRSADAVYASLTGRSDREDRDRSGFDTSASEEVVIRTGPLRWHTMVLGSGPVLAALRDVTTPNGLLVQGLTVATVAVEEWLGAALEFSPVGSDGALQISVPINDTGWYLTTDATTTILAARSEGRRIMIQFRRTFALSSVTAFFAALAVVILVAEADRLARQRARFAAAAAHELKTPLATLRLHGEMLAEDLGNRENSRTYAERMIPEIRRLGRVVTNMLDLSRLERGVALAHPVLGDLGTAVEECVARLRPNLEAAGLAVALKIAEEIPRARFDRDALNQILDNLLDNAERHTRGSEGRLARIVVATIGDQIKLTVTDNGPGIPRRARSALFRPFHRQAGAGGPSGLGLGLSIARSLARAQGGELEIEDATEAGAAFVWTLPAAEAIRN
jgi:signal transduction histidine kinase